LAVSALTFLAADSQRLMRFLNMTGLGPQSLRIAAQDPTFHSSVLEYLVGDERLLLQFAADAGLDPETVTQAHQALCGPPYSSGP
jgi:hypothetical protein